MAHDDLDTPQAGLDRRALIGGGCALALGGTASRAQGAPIPVERFGGGSRQGAIVLLYGSDGLTNAGRYELAARAIASAGYSVYLPRYFEATGDRRASYGEIRAKFPLWTEALLGAIQNDVPTRGRIGVVGFSLGGALALALAARSERVAAVVDFFGFLPAGLEDARRLAPTLILHGEADRIVPVANAAAIERLLQSRGIPVESRIYPGEGHGLSRAVLPDAIARTQDFLGRYV